MSQAPLTTAPARAGLIVTTTVAFHNFLLTVELLSAREATITVPLAAGWTTTVMEALPVRPPESLKEAVMVCVPTLSTALKEPPVPISPSRLEVQARLPVRSPSSASVAVPVKLMERPRREAGVVRLAADGHARCCIIVATPTAGYHGRVEGAHIRQRLE